MDAPNLSQSTLAYICGAMISVLLWLARGFARDMKRVKDTYVTREELTALLKTADERALALIAASDARALLFEQRQFEAQRQNTENFREIRGQLQGVDTKLFELAKVKPV